MTALTQVLLWNAAAVRRYQEAEARNLHLEGLVVAERARADRVQSEADALYAMLPEELRPTT